LGLNLRELGKQTLTGSTACRASSGLEEGFEAVRLEVFPGAAIVASARWFIVAQDLSHHLAARSQAPSWAGTPTDPAPEGSRLRWLHPPCAGGESIEMAVHPPCAGGESIEMAVYPPCAGGESIEMAAPSLRRRGVD
jgi:hypothetical protein